MVSVENRNVVFDIETNADYKQKPSIVAADLIVTEAFEEDGPGSVGGFVRGSRDSAYREGGLTSRLSTVIRRSLRLAPKRTTTVRQTSRTALEKKPSQLATVEEEKHVCNFKFKV